MVWTDPTEAATAGSPVPVVPRSDSAAAEPYGRLDLNTRVATIGAASMTLPGDPYELTQDPRRMPGLFDVLFMANASVHERYLQGDHGSRTWSATVMLARLSASVGGEGLEVRGVNALSRISGSFFDNHPTQLADVHWSDHSISSCTGVLMTGRVHYAIKHLPSRYDTVTAQIVQLGDNSVVVAVTSVPDDTDPALAAQASAAIGSLAVG